MKKLILLMILGVMSVVAKQPAAPVAIPVLDQSYTGVDVGQVYGAMATSVADFHIQMAVREACMVKFTSALAATTAFTWIVTCMPTPTGAITVHVKVTTNQGAIGLDKMKEKELAYVAGITEALWKAMTANLPRVMAIR